MAPPAYSQENKESEPISVVPGAQPEIAAETAAKGELGEEMEALQALKQKRVELLREAGSAKGDNLLVAEALLSETDDEFWNKLTSLVDALDQAEASVAQELTRSVLPELQAMHKRLSKQRRLLEVKINRLAALRTRREGVELLDLVDDLVLATGQLDDVYKRLLHNSSMRAQLSDPVEKVWKELDAMLVERRERLLAGLSVLDKQVDSLGSRPAETDEEKAIVRKEVKLLAILVSTTESSLKNISEQLQSREIDTADLDQLLLERSGKITLDVLNPDVALGLLSSWSKSVRNWYQQEGPSILFKLILIGLILLVFRLLASVARWIARRLVNRGRFSVLLQDFLVGLAGSLVTITGFIIALTQIGFSLGPILAGFGVVGFILGFALQETLSNFASGLMILAYRPFDVGDLIEAGGVLGHVREMTLVSTTITTVDNQRIIVPNNKIWGDVIKNVNAEEHRRVDMVFGIGYGDDIEKAQSVLEELVSAHPSVLAEPAPVICLHNLADSAVEFVVRPWTASEDYWKVYWDLTKAVKHRFDDEGISIPFPQHDMHVYKHAG